MEDKIQWEIKVPIFKNSIILKQLGIAIGIPFGILIFALLLLTKRDIYTLYAVGMVVGLLLITWLFIMIIYRGKYEVEFFLNNKGVLSRTQKGQLKKNKLINGLTLFLSLFSKQPAVAGASILADSRQEIFIPWKRVRSVIYKPKARTIILKGGFTENIALFCDVDNYQKIEQFILDKTTSSQA